MIDDLFKKSIASGKGCAVIMAGSDSDQLHIEKILKSLQAYEIPYEVRICSAHKQPTELMEMIAEYNAVPGSVAYIAVAGGTDALSGTVSFHALGPVISCPPDGFNQSCLANPPGSSNAYIQRPENIGRFVAQLYAGVNPELREKLQAGVQEKRAGLEGKDTEFRERYHG